MEQLVRTLTEASLYAEQRWQAQDGGVQLWVASCCLLAVIAVAVVFMLVRRESAKGESGLSSTLIEECSTRSTSSSDDSADEQGAMSLHVPRLSFSAIFNLEEFMAVAYQRGVRVTKICGGKTRKMRLLSLNRHGEVMLHKMGSAEVGCTPMPSLSRPSPYWRCPLQQMEDCFLCGEGESNTTRMPRTEQGGHPRCGFIMDFSRRGKTLHLEVDSALDRSYLVKGFRLLAQKARGDAGFFARSRIVLSTPLSSRDPVYVGGVESYSSRSVSQGEPQYVQSQYVQSPIKSSPGTP